MYIYIFAVTLCMHRPTVGIGRYRLKWLSGQWPLAKLSARQYSLRSLLGSELKHINMYMHM